MRIAFWLLLVGCLSAFTASAQEERREIISDAKSPLPMPLEGGSRWLRYALRTAREAIAPAIMPAPGPVDVTEDVRALEGVHQRLGNLGAGTFMDGAVSPAERQRIWQAMAQEWRTAEAAGPPSAAGAAGNNSGPFSLLETYSEPADPTHMAIAQLRLSARNLDQAAADLEDSGKYAEADRVRASANRLRREAREFASEQE